MGIEVTEYELENEGSRYMPEWTCTVHTSDGGVYELPSKWEMMKDDFIEEKIEDFDPTEWQHVDGPKWEPETDDEDEGGDTNTPSPVLGDWDESEMGIVSVDSSWRDGDKRRVKVEEIDGCIGEEVCEWHRGDKLEGDTVEIGGIVCEIDGFGKGFYDGGRKVRYMYVRVDNGDLIDTDKNSTRKSSYCPQCGGPTQVMGKPCDTCR